MGSLPRRLVASGVVLVLALPVGGMASAKEPKRLKAAKRALVTLESEADAAAAALDDLRAQARRVSDEVERLPTALETVDGPGFPALTMAAEFTRGHALIELGRRIDDAIIDTTRATWALAAERRVLIVELEGAIQQVVERRARRRGTGTAGEQGPLIVGGSLITYSADWEATARCESSGRWHVDARYDGGLQFDPITWIEFGGGEFARYAYQASKKEQIAVAERVLAVQGPKAWPVCFAALPFDGDV